MMMVKLRSGVARLCCICGVVTLLIAEFGHAAHTCAIGPDSLRGHAWAPY
jgi:hypothetical protein